MFKINESIIVIQAEEINPIQTKVVFWSHDRGTAKLIFKLVKNDLPQSLPEGTTVPIRLMFKSATAEGGYGKHDYLATIEDRVNGIVSIVLEDNILGYIGIVEGSVYIDFPNDRSLDTAGRFTFYIKRSPIDDSTPELEDYYFNGFSQTIDKIEKILADGKLEIEQKISESETQIDAKLKDTNDKIAKANQDVETINTNIDKTNDRIDQADQKIDEVLSGANEFLTDIDTLKINKADKIDVNQALNQVNDRISNFPKGNPSGVYTTLADLKTAFPNGNSNIYVVSADGNWYYWSGTAWTVGSTYQGKMISVKSVQTDKLANLVIGKNLFNKDVLEPGYLDRSDGVVIPDTNNVTAGFRYIDSSKGYLTFSKIANGALNVCFYDSNYKFISGSGIQITPDAVHTIAINPEAVFVRFSINRLDVEKMQLEYGQTQSEFEAFYQFDPDQKKIGEDEPPKIESPEQIENAIISTEKLANLVTGKNLFNKATTVTGYLERSDGTVVPDSANQTSDFILIEPNSSYVLTPKIVHGAVNLVKYDRNKQPLSSQQILPNSTDQVIKTDNSEVYIRFSINNLHVDETQLEKGQEATEFEAYFKYNPDLVMPVVKGADNVANKLLVSKPSDGNTAFQIYCPAGAENTYFEYGIGYESKPYTDGGTYQNAELWRIVGGKMVELNTQTGSVIKSDQVVNAGAWECAIEIDGLPDFHGTYHGYEKMDSIDMYTNNVKADINGVFNVWVDTFKIIYRSKLIKQGTEADYIADVLRIYEWGPDGLKLTQRYNWLQSFARIKNAYLTMLPILRWTNYQDPSSKLITDTAYTDLDFIEYDVSGTNFQPGINAQIDNINQAVIYGTQSKISADVTVNYKNNQIKNMFNVSNAEQYNKFYYSYCTGQGVNIGDKWEVESIFKFKKV